MFRDMPGKKMLSAHFGNEDLLSFLKYCDIRYRIQAYTVFSMSTCKITEIFLCQKFTKLAFLGFWMMKGYKERGYNGIHVLLMSKLAPRI